MNKVVRIVIEVWLILGCIASGVFSYKLSQSNVRVAELETEVKHLKEEATADRLISVEPSEYQMVRSFVDLVIKEGGLSTTEADTYINQLNQIINLQKQIDHLTPSQQKILRFYSGEDDSRILQSWLNNGWRVKTMTGGTSGRYYVLIEK